MFSSERRHWGLQIAKNPTEARTLLNTWLPQFSMDAANSVTRCIEIGDWRGAIEELARQNHSDPLQVLACRVLARPLVQELAAELFGYYTKEGALKPATGVLDQCAFELDPLTPELVDRLTEAAIKWNESTVLFTLRRRKLFPTRAALARIESDTQKIAVARKWLPIWHARHCQQERAQTPDS